MLLGHPVFVLCGPRKSYIAVLYPDLRWIDFRTELFLWIETKIYLSNMEFPFLFYSRTFDVICQEGTNAPQCCELQQIVNVSFKVWTNSRLLQCYINVHESVLGAVIPDMYLQFLLHVHISRHGNFVPKSDGKILSFFGGKPPSSSPLPWSLQNANHATPMQQMFKPHPPHHLSVLLLHLNLKQ